jgi:hypothetical protein
VDAWAALLLELGYVLDDLRDVPSAPRFLAMAANGDALGRLGPASALRAWLAPTSCVDGHDDDELPELALPARLAVRLTPGSSIDAFLRADRIGLAVACDRRAALEGRTLESWALCAAVRASASG